MDKGKSKVKYIIPSLVNEKVLALAGKEVIEYGLKDTLSDMHIRIRKGQFNIILGHPGCGKTTFSIWFYYQMAVKHELKTTIYSGENDVEEIITQLVEMMTGYRMQMLSVEEVEYSLDFIHEYFTFIDDKYIYEAEDLFERFENDDSDLFSIDPHNALRVPSGLNWYQYSVQLGQEIRSFCRRTDKTIFLVAHPNTEAQRRKHIDDGDLKGMKIPPIAADMEGGSVWKNKCDNFWITHRYENHVKRWNETLIIVEKVKYQNTGVMPTMIDDPLVFTRRANFDYSISK